MIRKTSGNFIITLLVFVLLSININIIGITVAQETHDIAVVGFTPYPIKVGVGLNELVDLTVIVENQGTQNETFTVTVSYGNETIQPTIIDTKNVIDQTPNTNKTLTFMWNTTGLTVGRYFFNATASFVSNETDTSDNTFISPSDKKFVEDYTVAVVSPYIAVYPRSTVDNTLTPGKNYTISILTDYNGSDIWGYQFSLIYNPSVLEGVDVVNGDLISNETVVFSPGTFNNTIGELGLTLAFSENQSAPQPYPLLNNTGPGVLANVTFTIVEAGDSPIEFDMVNIKMMRTDGTNIIDQITHLDEDLTQGKILDGFFQNVEEVVHDIAVTKLDFSPNNVTAGEPVNINVTTKNNGTVNEEVIVTVYWGFGGGVPLHPIGETDPFTIGSDENKTMSFTWDTTEATDGTHPLVAVVDYTSDVIEDVNPDNNMLLIDDAVAVTVFQGTPFPIELFVIIAVVIVALVTIYIIIRRIRK